MGRRERDLGRRERILFWDPKSYVRRTVYFKCFSREAKFLPLSRIRKYARKTRAYRRAYRDGKSNTVDLGDY